MKYFKVFLLFVLSICVHSQAVDNACPESTETLFQTLFDIHYKSLKYVDIRHDPYWMCFSGVPGMGKTYIAELLEERYQAVHLSTDQIRILIKTYHDGANSEKLVEQYFLYFMSAYKGLNKRIVFDASIDRRYKLLFPFLHLAQIPFVVIRLQVPFDQIIERIKQRDKEAAANYLKFFDSWYADYEAFGRVFPYSYLLNNAKNDSQIEKLFEFLDSQLNSCLLHTNSEINSSAAL